jgi:hypothetical protein
MKKLLLFTVLALTTIGAMAQDKLNHNTSRSSKSPGGKVDPNTAFDKPANFDNTNLEINERAFFNVISKGYKISWNKSSQSNYTYSLKLIPVNTNEPSKIKNLFRNSKEGITKNNLRTNSFTITQKLKPNKYYALLVVKHPVGISFKEFIATVDDDSVHNYFTTWYYVSEGGVGELPGAIDGCGDALCGSKCEGGVCPSGSIVKCGCSTGSCFAQLCASVSGLTSLNVPDESGI